MLKWAKLVLAVLLLPVCAGAGVTLARVVRQSSGADTFWVAFVGGAASWLSIFLLLPKPMWAYVFGHELTHALWTWLFAGQVKRFKVSAKGGEVAVTRTNFLINRPLKVYRMNDCDWWCDYSLEEAESVIVRGYE